MVFAELEFEKRALNLLVFLKVKLKNVISSQNQILQRIENIEKYIDGKTNCLKDVMDINTMDDCPLPINNEVDLTVFEDKTLRDKTFKINLISNFNKY